jgi:cyclic pyranopterin phosphate synthase
MATSAPADALGRALRDLRISVTDRCNFRCPYCMPAEVFGESYRFLPKERILTFEEIERLARIFVELGARKLRLTGGEPLLRRELPALVARLSSIPQVEDVALTTNGTSLAELAAPLAAAGLRRVTVSLDSLDDEAFRKMSGRHEGPDVVLAGIEAAERAGLVPIKINCVVVRGVNESAVVDLVRRFKGTGHIVRFIEYMDVGTMNEWRRDDVVTADEMLALLRAEFRLEELEANYDGEVALRYRHAGGGGEIGIIASVSRPFCRGCTRARLSADGRLITCLFATDGLDLKTPLRSGAGDAELAEMISGCWAKRTDRYSELRAQSRAGLAHGARVEMFEVGG